MQKEGQVRIPSGCAISGIFSRSGERINGESIVESIATMHDRSNGLGGGFAGYGIYPEYKELYALHIFYDSSNAKDTCEAFLETHFDIVNLSKIPVKMCIRDRSCRASKPSSPVRTLMTFSTS